MMQNGNHSESAGHQNILVQQIKFTSLTAGWRCCNKVGQINALNCQASKYQYIQNTRLLDLAIVITDIFDCVHDANSLLCTRVFRTWWPQFSIRSKVPMRWRVTIKRTSRKTRALWTPGKHDVICHQHFTENDYKGTLLGY